MEHIITNLGIVLLAALLQSGFQLNFGCLTLLYKRAFGIFKTKNKASELSSSFISGVGLLNLLIIMAMCFVLTTAFNGNPPTYVFAIVAGILIGLGISIFTSYFRYGPGTSLWIPRGLADFLDKRAKKASTNTDAFSFGIMSNLGEAPLTLILVFISGIAIISLPNEVQLLAAALHAVISILPLVIVKFIADSKNDISRVQKWRDSNKNFIKFIVGSGLAIFAIYVFVFKVLPTIGGIA